MEICNESDGFDCFADRPDWLARRCSRPWPTKSCAIDRAADVVTARKRSSIPNIKSCRPDSEADWLTDFTLTERNGKTVRWSELAGKVRVVSFFFSSCPANCLRQNMKVREVERAYAGKDVVCVSITCDPDIDSPERLAEYAVKLEATTGSMAVLDWQTHLHPPRRQRELFGVALDKQTHTERLIVCDKWGKIRGTYLWNKLDEMAQLRMLVDKLLAETEPPPADPAEKK